jgi:hypothetical protein
VLIDHGKAQQLGLLGVAHGLVEGKEKQGVDVRRHADKE